MAIVAKKNVTDNKEIRGLQNELVTLLLKKSGVTLDRLYLSARKQFVSSNLDLLTLSERKKFEKVLLYK